MNRLPCWAPAKKSINELGVIKLNWTVLSSRATMLESSSSSLSPKSPRNSPVSVAMASSRMMREALWGTSLAVNGVPSWNSTSSRRWNVHWVPSSLASQLVAMPGTREPSNRSVCTNGSVKGRTWVLAEVVVPSQLPTNCWTGGMVAMRRRPPSCSVSCAAVGVLVGLGVAVAITVGMGVAAAGAAACCC